MSTYENTAKVGSGQVPLYPRFYFKHVSGRISIYHRFTHCYLECYETEKEVLEAMEEWAELPQKDLWDYLLFEKHAQLVKPLDFPRTFSHDEEWYFSAWGIYTAKFYEKYPEVFREEIEMPFSIAFRIKQAYLDKEHQKYKKAQQERESASERIAREEKQARREAPREEVKVEIGNAEQVEQAQKRIKKVVPLKKKRGIKLKSPIVNDNPFD